MDDNGSAIDDERAYAQRMAAEAIEWPTDRKVLLAPMEDGNARVEVVAVRLLGDAASGSCVAQLADEPDRWYCGGDNGDHVLLWGWEESQEEAWMDLY